ncbi:hypothetical protein Tsubulata_017033 [Turnera subulata]|uniref:Homeobox domain-containing protein n=1 Tax=Turnera subulata TaxID=218843 RepID=A0A9Q0FFT2_9ROSI|nr:hypothetical protein Tsubulata_017033 [Turnera subulata]
MEANSEGEKANNKNMSNSNEGSSKPKRQMKTPYQLETLEKAYAMETYPTEAMRQELSKKLGLNDRQLQMWFCHRRLKDKKDNTPSKKPRKVGPMPGSPNEEMRTMVPVNEPASDYGSGSGSGSSPIMEPRRMASDDVHMSRGYYESSPQSVMELRAIACVEAQLGEPLREDGPILGMEFDPLPPDAFGAPIAAMGEQQKRSGYPYDSKVYERREAKSSKASARAHHEYQLLQDESSVRSDGYGQISQSPYHDTPVDCLRGRGSPFIHASEPPSRVHGGQASRIRLLPQQDKRGNSFSSPHRDDDYLLQRDSFTNNRISAQSVSHPNVGPENPDILSDAQMLQNDTELRMERKRKVDEGRTGKEAEANEIRLRRELEKQDILRRKNEERMRKEMERHDRERRKEEERLMRERQREEERSLREQKRELERREKFLQKEHLRAEKMRQKEELRREREEVKRKAAMEKATARRIAKESLDLIEDEQLELMELAAASKGLPSIVQLDYDTLQNLELFRGSLRTFPPESVQLKKPFSLQPWMDSEENVGNLLMVWRFFITFADVLGLWPFTLSEFVQAFHDYDSRLLGEIHIALLKLIIKDIEDVARTPSSGLGTNQYCSANPEGGHPQIVEGAYTWGFDIRNWQRYLNPLTWPEIFRQLALSAGFGPQLKKRSTAWGSLGENDEVKGCEDVISNLRNGLAAENAFSLMRDKGLLLPRRSRHRLTPGTVKFAAFHVLSLEGSKGLTVLELADKIQKSGLRDLTTSKTPEASISVALTRDQKLFERIAPSTYCVRAAFRKDPADAEAILSAARKKIRIFENGFLGTEDADDVERDEDSEGDVDEDPEVEDLATPLNASKSVADPNEANAFLGSGKDNICSEASLAAEDKSPKDLLSYPMNGPVEAMTSSTTKQGVVHETVRVGNLNEEENVEIDESRSGASWIQGLTEGEYSHLSVEERLNAIVTLVGVANEGNSIRAVLEDRLEAANALKKQMWAEAQLDRGRFKEDILSKLDFPSFTGGRAESQLPGSAMEGNQSPLTFMDGRNKEASPSTAEEKKPLLGSEDVQNHLNGGSSEKPLVVYDPSLNSDNFLAQQHGYASKRSRSQLKAYVGHMAEEMYVYRSLPLGQDRRRNRYWQFVASASKNDPCSGRIFVELHDGNWRVIDTEEAFDVLLSSLDVRGVRESHLRLMLQKVEACFKENVRRNLQSENIVCQNGTADEDEKIGMDSSPNCSADFDSPSSTVCGSNSDTVHSSLFRIELGKNAIEKKRALKRYQELEKWMWKECFNPSTVRAMKHGKERCMQLLVTCSLCLDSYPREDIHCKHCHQTFASVNTGFDFSKHEFQCKGRKLEPGDVFTRDSSQPLGIRLLKALLAFIEAHVRAEALESCWIESHRKTWAMKLNVSSSPEELLQILTAFESGITRDWLSSNFEKTKELLGSSTLSGFTTHDSPGLISVSVLPWIPKTTGAVALRLFELDGSVTYIPQQKIEPSEEKAVKVYMKLPSRGSPFKNEEAEVKGAKLTDVKDENLPESRNRRNTYKRGRVNRDQGSSSRRKVSSSKPETGKRSAKGVENLSQGLRQQGRKTNLQASARGRRTVRKRRSEKMVREDTLLGYAGGTASRMSKSVSRNSYGVAFRNLDAEEWPTDKVGMDNEAVDNEAAENSNSMEEAESEDNVEEDGYEQGNWDQRFNDSSNGWNRNSMEVSDDDGDGSGDDDGAEAIENEVSEGDVEMSDGSDGVANKMGDDAESDSAASDEYSD